MKYNAPGKVHWDWIQFQKYVGDWRELRENLKNDEVTREVWGWGDA